MTALSQATGPYEITWSTIDGGGGTSTGGNYTLSGTIGQPDAGMMSGGDYKLVGGFWSGCRFCFVNLSDLEHFLAEWLRDDCEELANDWCVGADFNHDGEVNLEDYNLFMGSWLKYCPDNWPSW